jgi:hypothetical protein
MTFTRKLRRAGFWPAGKRPDAGNRNVTRQNLNLAIFISFLSSALIPTVGDEGQRRTSLTRSM